MIIFYNSGKELISDYAYDEIKNIFREVTKSSNIRFNRCSNRWNSKKLKLPYWMGSMTKVKPNDKHIK